MRSTKKKEDGISSKFPSEKSLQDFREYQSKYVRDNYRSFMFRPRRDTDSDVITFCESKDSFSSYILKLVKEDMVRNGVIPKTYDKMLIEAESDSPVVFKTNEPAKLSCHIVFKLASKSLTATAVLEAIKEADFGSDIIINQAVEINQKIEFDLTYSCNRSLIAVANIIAAEVSEKVKAKDEAYAKVFEGENNIFSGWEI